MVFYDCDFGNSNLKYAENLNVKYTDLPTEDVAISITLTPAFGSDNKARVMRIETEGKPVTMTKCVLGNNIPDDANVKDILVFTRVILL
jgi:hypothetical protein